MKARKRVVARLQAIARSDPEYKVGVAAGVWLDDLDAIEVEAVTAALDALATKVEELGKGQTRVDELTGYMGWDYQRAIAAVLALIAEARR